MALGGFLIWHLAISWGQEVLEIAEGEEGFLLRI